VGFSSPVWSGESAREEEEDETHDEQHYDAYDDDHAPWIAEAKLERHLADAYNQREDNGCDEKVHLSLLSVSIIVAIVQEHLDREEHERERRRRHKNGRERGDSDNGPHHLELLPTQ
jgi:hypothetical protein